MKICLQSSNDKISTFLEQHFAKRNSILHFKTSIADYNHFDAVLLVQPFELNSLKKASGQYSSLFKIWKRYLHRETKNTKLIIAGFEDIDHPNYLQVLQVGKSFNLENMVKNSLPCSDDWEDAIPVNGMCILDKLSLFFKGHNELGIIDTIAKLRGNLNNAYLHYYGSNQLKINKKSFSYVWTEFLRPVKESSRILFSRWYNYKNLFKPYPFYQLIEEKEIDVFIEELRKLTKDRGKITMEPHNLKKKEDAFQKLNAYDKIDKVIKVFEKINKKYINIENAGTILLVDDDIDFQNRIYHSFPSYEIVHAYNKKEARTLLENKKIDLVLLDLNLETNEQDGLEFLPEVKQKFKTLPVIIVSTIDDKKIIKKTLENGASYYLRKTRFDAASWNKIFIHVLGDKLFSHEHILEFNQPIDLLKKSILIIDDEERWFKNIKRISTKYNYEWASTFTQAKDTLRENRYDLILLDLIFKKNKEEKEGLRFLPDLKKISNNAPIIVFTIDDNVKTGSEALSRGATYFLRKDGYDVEIWLNTFELVINANQYKRLVKNENELIEEVTNE